MTHSRAKVTPQLLQDIRGERRENPPMAMRTPEPTAKRTFGTTGIFKQSRLHCVDMIVKALVPDAPRVA